jgi:hypothetical protein
MNMDFSSKIVAIWFYGWIPILGITYLLIRKKKK